MHVLFAPPPSPPCVSTFDCSILVVHCIMYISTHCLECILRSQAIICILPIGTTCLCGRQFSEMVEECEIRALMMINDALLKILLNISFKCYNKYPKRFFFVIYFSFQTKIKFLRFRFFKRKSTLSRLKKKE